METTAPGASDGHSRGERSCLEGRGVQPGLGSRGSANESRGRERHDQLELDEAASRCHAADAAGVGRGIFERPHHWVGSPLPAEASRMPPRATRIVDEGRRSGRAPPQRGSRRYGKGVRKMSTSGRGGGRGLRRILATMTPRRYSLTNPRSRKRTRDMPPAPGRMPLAAAAAALPR